MKKKELTALLQEPSSINTAHTPALKAVIEEYPYFQAARAVRLKALKNENSLHYNKELKITAAYTVDRSVLFDFITSEAFNQNEIANQIRQQEHYQENIPVFDPEEVRPETNLSLDQALKMKVRESEQVFDPELFSRQENAKEGAIDEEANDKKAEEDTLHLGSPLSFDRNENHSFTEWLKLTTAKPVAREEDEIEDEDKSRKFELIDEFISKNPKITPSKSAKKANLAHENLAAPEALMTETLARVYLEQKNYKKAIQAYKILILKNPEKSGFFADQIRAIEKLQEQ
ncbi:hypothetical protein [Salinimicrobium sp. GXAS 041]|uniref:hypothetical protein n=1 Tax=Salinimicrobium sp. GXAS 041 TaxID=3400806 RepID=UPI003C7601C5